jgi:hypothetical protein
VRALSIIGTACGFVFVETGVRCASMEYGFHSSV